MIIDQHLDRNISERLVRSNKKRSESHTPSGKLSASMLGQPIQWQVLKTLGVKGKKFDAYTLRKFERGNHVEDWLVGQMPGVVDKQKYVEYRDVVGYVDTIVNTSEGYDFKNGLLVNEIKSITNAAFNWMMKDKTPKYGHCLQACLYALAEKQTYFALTYVASDDYRVWMVVQKVSKYKEDVDSVIDKYNEALENKIIPEFKAIEGWQKKPLYNNYPEWSELTPIELDLKAKKLKWPKK